MPSYITLAEYSAFLEQSGKMLTSGIVDVLRKESFLLDIMQFPSVSALKVRGLRIKSLPTLQNRKLNAQYTHSTGSIEPIEETSYLFGGRVDVDHRLANKPGMIVDPAAWNLKMYATSLAYGWSHDMLNNDGLANADSITGLRTRLRNDFSGQIIDASAVDISPDSATAEASFNTFFDRVQEAIYSCREHTCDAIITNDTVKLRIDSGLRRLGLWSSSVDSFGRTVTNWGPGGPKIYDIGVDAAQAKIMPNTETSAGLETGGALSSLMFVKFGPEYLTGWQDDEGLKSFEWQTGVLKHVELDWAAGIMITDPRSVAWLINVTAA